MKVLLNQLVPPASRNVFDLSLLHHSSSHQVEANICKLIADVPTITSQYCTQTSPGNKGDILNSSTVSLLQMNKNKKT